MPGSPSPGGRKPGICQTGQLVTRKGPEGSNPSPGAYFEEPSTSLKALAAESRAEEVTTTMKGLTGNMTAEQKQTMSTADTNSNSRLLLQAPQPYSSLPRKEDGDGVIANVSIDRAATPSSLGSATLSTPSIPDG
jgi:hypothetical protein